MDLQTIPNKGPLEIAEKTLLLGSVVQESQKRESIAVTTDLGKTFAAPVDGSVDGSAPGLRDLARATGTWSKGTADHGRGGSVILLS